MRSFPINLLAATIAIAAIAALPVQAAELGDPAGKLSIAEWIKGEPVDMKAGDTTYVVEFWATWCAPCLQSIPHLTEMQEKYKDDNVVFIGVSDEDAATVKPFVDEMGAKMDYWVAIDPERKTHEAYMDAYGQGGIPTAFVVDSQLRVAWVGHPMAELEQVLDEIVAGTYDVAVFKKKMEQREAQRALVMDLFRACEEGNQEAVNAAAGKGLELYADDKDFLNAVSWTLLDHANAKIRNPQLALKIAEQAMKAGGEKDAMVVDTYARALFDTGDAAKAVEAQKNAVALAEDPELRQQMEETLARYQGQ